MELYGGFITFCPEWLTMNINLDASNFMYKWVYLVFFNMLWVFIPIYAIWVASNDINDAFLAKSKTSKSINDAFVAKTKTASSKKSR